MKIKFDKTNMAIAMVIIGTVVVIVALIVFAVILSDSSDKKSKKNVFTHSSNIEESNNSSAIFEETNSPKNYTSSKNDSAIESSNETKTETPKNQNTEKSSKITEIYPLKSNFKVPEFLKETFYDSKNNNTIPYRLAKPQNYDSTKKYPVILFLHGLGDTGTDNEKQIKDIKNMYEYNGDLVSQAFVVCPQSNEWWDIDRYTTGDRKGSLGSVLHLLEELEKTYSFDSNRIYVTGLSMGGYGTWSLLQECSDIFAAGMPVCGGGNAESGYKMKETPIRIYHSTDDPTVSFSASSKMYDSVINAGGSKVELVILNGLGHNAWDYAYSDREGFSWLFAQNKGSNPTGEYQYIPYFKVVDSKGQTIIWDEDIELIDHSVDQEKDEYVYIVNIYLNTDGANKLSQSYKSNAADKYTVYWANEKLYTFTASKNDDSNMFVIEGVFSSDNVYDFYKTVEKSSEILRDR